MIFGGDARPEDINRFFISFFKFYLSVLGASFPQYSESKKKSFSAHSTMRSAHKGANTLTLTNVK